MTDRIHSLTVVLEQNIREDDVQGLIDAIARLRHVLSVRPHVANIETHMAEERARTILTHKILEALK